VILSHSRWTKSSRQVSPGTRGAAQGYWFFDS
jgi:hypothetical protein